MKPYKNLSGKSGVKAYEIGNKEMRVMFVNGDLYLYNHSKPGRRHLSAMIELAEAGRGLSTYISRYVRDNFYRKLR